MPATAAIAAVPASDVGFVTSLRQTESSARVARSRRESAVAGKRRVRARENRSADRGASDARLPEVPPRAAVIAAMTRVTPAALACFGDVRGVAKARLFVRGSTGRVVHARVDGIPGRAGSCIARAVRRAAFPKFQKERLEISYPFRR
jgi:hypothetical protein